MRIHRDHGSLPAAARGASVAIGNFDGVHRGHREVIRTAAGHAGALGRPLGVITFEPHPRELLNPVDAPARLTPLRRKAELLQALGVEHLYVFRFDAPPDATLAPKPSSRTCCWGSRCRGDHHRPRFPLRPPAPWRYAAAGRDRLALRGCRRPPSTRWPSPVRPAPRPRSGCPGGWPGRAGGALLGSPYELEGVVRPGDQRGRTIGFPTANMHPLAPRPMLPATGVYAVEAGLRLGREISGSRRWPISAAGPTFDGRSLLLEVHLLEGGGDLYGQRLRGRLQAPPARRAEIRRHRRAAKAQIAARLRRSARGPPCPHSRLSQSPIMSTDYRDTVFLPRTDFPMRGRPAEARAARLLARWEAMGLYRPAARGVARAREIRAA